MTTQPVRFAYKPGLDGFRALAVALVLVTHSLPRSGGGSIGVHMFFVLSGFLITSLILEEEASTGQVRFRHFYVRRALRLMPALLFTCVVVALLPNVYVGPDDGESLSRWVTIPAAIGYVANFVGIFGGPLGFLAHAWSLAIEEQFYLLWPAAAVALLRRNQLARALPWLIGLAIASRAMMAASGVPSTSAWLLAQADQLLVGAWLACLYRRGLPSWVGRSVVGAAVLACLAALTLGVSLVNESWDGPVGYYGGLTIVAFSSALLIGHLVQGNGPICRLFAWAPAVLLGRLSYGTYLLHFPVFQFVQHQRWDSRIVTLAVEYGSTAVLVCFSWLAIERPALRLKERFGTVHPPAQVVNSVVARQPV